MASYRVNRDFKVIYHSGGIQYIMNAKRTRTRASRRRRTNLKTMSDQLTGGSNDVNPQYIHNSVSQTLADTNSTQQITLPIDRLGFGGNRIGVVEVLAVFFDWRNPLSAATAVNLTAALTTKSFAATKVLFNEPTCFAYMHLFSTLTTTGGTLVDMPMRYDCTDDSGHGIVVATDAIFLNISSLATGQANIVDVKIEYRYKNVTTVEYIGVVQSQS